MNIFSIFTPHNRPNHELPVTNLISEFSYSPELEQSLDKLRQLDADLHDKYVRVEVYNCFGKDLPKSVDAYECTRQVEGIYCRSDKPVNLDSAFELYSKFAHAKFDMVPIERVVPWNTEAHGFDASPIFSWGVIKAARIDPTVQQSYTYKDGIFVPTLDCQDKITCYAELKVYIRSDWNANRCFSIVVTEPAPGTRGYALGRQLLQVMASIQTATVEKAFNEATERAASAMKEEADRSKLGLVADIPIGGDSYLELKDFSAYGRYVLIGVLAPDWSTRDYRKGIDATRKVRVMDTGRLLYKDEINLTFDKKDEILTENIDRIVQEFGVTINCVTE